MVRGPDGAPFVLDAATASVYRIDLRNGKAQVIFREGNRSPGGTQAAPKLLAVGGRHLLMVDARNVLWRWAPANNSGKGTINKVRVAGATEWGDDIRAVGTFLRDPEANLYNLYVVDQSAQQILRYSPSADGGGFPDQPSRWLGADRDVSGITSLYIDGDVWLADAGELLRMSDGNSAGWEATLPEDEVLRSAPSYRLVGSGSEGRVGTLYGFDPVNRRVIALSKVNGNYLEQYRLAAGDPGWADLRGWYVEPGLEGEPDTLVWLSAGAVHRAVLVGTTPGPGASGAPASSAGAPSPGTSR